MNRLTLILWGLVLSMTSAACSMERNSRFSYSYDHINSWSFLEELVVSQPQRSVNAWFGRGGISVLASLGAGYLTYLGSKQLFDHASKVGKVASVGAGLGVGFMSYSALQTYLLNRAERNQILMIMKLWNQLRDRIPYEVWPMLDILYNSYLNDKTLFESQIDETLSYLKAEVYGKFPSRYKTTSESFFTSRNLSVQIRVNLYKFLTKGFVLLKELLN